MDQVKRIDATQAREKSRTGEAVLVCAYEDENRCRQLLLDGAMTLAEFEATLSTRSRNDEIIFYCA